jgi:hypothetical protein
MIILDILSALLIGFISGGLTMFLLYLIGDPWKDQVNVKAIFSRIGMWVDRGYSKVEKRRSEIASRAISDKDHQNALTGLTNWFMAAGACPYCFGVYVNLAFAIPSLLMADVSLWWIFATIPASQLAISWLVSRSE